ncbi:hypothetical protein IEQ34_011598 [Dendrobium chrysotoxum]|uniref:BHLH domain-containing protein n=1 Tax=Dendrobium chrysotoxum TaxID=161865 RepID=A0AAV7GSQ8_DENCH|nr:hypothetical protein IEQ34_011598 [Dendrobium chrysotoxum]
MFRRCPGGVPAEFRRMDFEVHSEVAEALIGFLNDNDPSLHSIDALFRNDIMGYIQEQPPPLFEPHVYPTMADYSSAPTLSTQSVAARKRRKRISEKTQELARLIPSGIKMNTADMFQAAYKYIKFLQAQLAILQLMASTLEYRSAKEEEYLHVMLNSLAIQERLAAEGMCIVASPSGGLYFKNETWVKETQGKHVIIHNNYITGFEKKIRQYAHSAKATTKGDVYSFGVVLMELITGKKPIDVEFGENKDIIYWVSNKMATQDGPLGVFDKRPSASPFQEEMIQMLSLRPSMNESMAARKRRKRISEKTQELAQLIPGGIKMNTVDMFQAAYKYIKMDFEVHSEVAEALIGFLNDDDPSLHSIDTLFQNDIMGYIQQQPPPLFEPNIYPIMAGCSGPNLSTQSVAARKRRKRISEKTQELARLIPSGIKMNTADMFQTAYKYIKFLQAQLAILQLMASTLECRSAKEEEYLHVLLNSLAIQERLAAEGMCINLVLKLLLNLDVHCVMHAHTSIHYHLIQRNTNEKDNFSAPYSTRRQMPNISIMLNHINLMIILLEVPIFFI